jgi:hypothetical protein
MPENDRFDGYLNEIELDFVEREAIPKLLMKLGIQLHLTGLSLSNTVSILKIFDVSRARSTVYSRFTRQSYSPKLVAVRVTSRLTKP